MNTSRFAQAWRTAHWLTCGQPWHPQGKKSCQGSGHADRQCPLQESGHGQPQWHHWQKPYHCGQSSGYTGGASSGGSQYPLTLPGYRQPQHSAGGSPIPVAREWAVAMKAGFFTVAASDPATLVWSLYAAVPLPLASLVSETPLIPLINASQCPLGLHSLKIHIANEAQRKIKNKKFPVYSGFPLQSTTF